MLPDRDVVAPAVVRLAGPTAVGKSEVALLLAERIEGEIISVDSMQVYRGLEIGTAKPTAAERQRVVHHLLDVVGLEEPFDAATFVGLARRAVNEIQARGRRPILCGGTGLYFKGFLEGFGEVPPVDSTLRAELESIPLPRLLRELAERDPETFAAMDRRNPRRVIRAVEVIRQTGRAFSAQRAVWSRGPQTSPFFVLSRRTADLHARIGKRVDEMFARGLVEETRELLARGLAENRTAMQAIGYRQVVEHLRGERSLAETIALVKTRTRQLAKRQMTWFRRHATPTWLEITADEPATAVVERLLREIPRA